MKVNVLHLNELFYMIKTVLGTGQNVWKYGACIWRLLFRFRTVANLILPNVLAGSNLLRDLFS